MTFQLKNFISIVASMVNHMRATQTQITDFNIGSVARTLVEAPAVEIDELYQQCFNGIRAAIPVATFNTFQFSKLPAGAASGLVAVTIAVQTADVLIGAKTAFSNPAVPYTYFSQTDVVIPAGSTTANVYVVASAVGSATNLPAGTAFSASPSPTGFTGGSNPAAFSNGTDLESDDQRQQRFILYLNSLPRGTDAGLVYGAKTTALYDANGLVTEKVAAAVPVNGTAVSTLYIHNGVGATSAGLVAQCQNVIDGYTDALGVAHVGWKAAGVVVTVTAAAEVAVPVTGLITPMPGYFGVTLIPAVKNVINGYITGLDLPQSFIFSELTQLIMEVPGIFNFHFTTPTADIAASGTQKFVPGTLTITSTV